MKNGCDLCKYKIADVYREGKSGYYCTNQESKKFGEEAQDGCDLKEEFEAIPDMSFKEALEKLIMLPEGAYPDYFFVFGKDGKIKRPFYCVTFTNNKQMFEYREAMMRCFDELMKMEKENGDFAEDE